MDSLKSLHAFIQTRLKNSVKPINDPLASFVLPFTVFKYSGMTLNKKSSWSYIVCGIFAHIFLLDIPIVLQLIHLSQAKDIIEVTEVVSIVATFISTCFETTVLYYNIDKIKAVIEEIRCCIVEFGVGEKFNEQVMIMTWILKRAIFFIFFSLLLAMCSCIKFGKPFYFMWTPFDMQDPLIFCIIFIYQFLSCWIASPINVSLQFLPAHFMVYIYRLAEQLCERLEKIKKYSVLNPDGTINQAKRVDNRQELIKCIELHSRIHHINSRVCKTFSIVLLFRTVMSCVLISSINFSLFAISDVAIITKYTTYSIYIFCQLFVSCYFGSKIIEASSRISSAIVHSEWMLEKKEYRQLVRTMLEFSKKPMKISIFGNFDVNLENYTSVCRSAYSLFAVCKQLNDN
jgi:hypothetical protein